MKQEACVHLLRFSIPKLYVDDWPEKVELQFFKGGEPLDTPKDLKGLDQVVQHG